MECIKKPFPTEEVANAAKNYHNLRAVDEGWKVMKRVYFCEEHKAWHITARNTKQVSIRLLWLQRHKDEGKQFLKRRNKVWDHYMEICQNSLLLPNGTYRKPTKESHALLMESLVGRSKQPIRLKYIKMWWLRLPDDKKQKE